MLEFEMPSKKEEKRRKRFEESLKAAGIGVKEESFFLDIEEGKILKKIHDEIGVENLRRELSLGCAANVPSIECRHNNGNRLTYVRMLNTDAAEGLYDKNIPVIGKIVKSMSNPSKYSESLFASRRGKNAIIQSESGAWCLKVKGIEIINSGQDGTYLEDAVGLVLDFYRSNNI